jgi:hypothetical protein
MAEQTFKSPGFFEKEIDLTIRSKQNLGIPAGVIGTSLKGPAFVPVTVGSMTEFENKFGGLNHELFGPYAVNEFLKNRTAITYVKVLGAGANSTTNDILNTQTNGTVKNAGFIIKGNIASAGGSMSKSAHAGCVQFLVANHEIHESSLESISYPIFTDNDSFGSGQANMVRGVLFLATGSRMEILDSDAFYSHIKDDRNQLFTGSISAYDNSKTQGTFKLVLSSSAGATFNTTEGSAGIKIYTASLNPSSDYYISKVLNTDHRNFQKQEHLLYLHYPVEDEIVRVKYESGVGTVALLSGSTDTLRNNYGRFDTRYSNSRTTSFISQPYGDKEYDLFHFETLDDGANTQYNIKASISNIRRSTDPLDPYGTFSVEIRNYSDVDQNTQVIEQFTNCNLNPNSEDYIAKKIGDEKIFYNFDALSDSERRLVKTGKFINKSNHVRIVMNAVFDNPGNIPKSALPFGFRGIPALITNNSLKDEPTINNMLTGQFNTGSLAVNRSVEAMSGSIIPPLPFTIKATRGAVKEAGSYFGDSGNSEVSDSRVYWGVKTTRLPLTSSLTKAALYTNAGGLRNEVTDNYIKFSGIQKLNVLTTGSMSDTFNNNKFTLARVTFANAGTVSAQITGSAADHMLEAVYVRNGIPDAVNNLININDSFGNRITLATLINNTSAKYFNRFAAYNKFTNVFYGGFDGLNIFDTDVRKMNDRASSSDTGGKALNDGNNRLGLSSDYKSGTGLDNNIVKSYRTAINIITDPMNSNINIVSIPGQRDSFITDYLVEKVEEYGKAIAVIDIPNYDDDGTRLFDGQSTIPSVRETSERLDSRSLDSSFAATYFPNIKIQDENSSRIVTVPASIAAIGALGFNDSVSYPWFAPAGFNRGSLSFVKGTQSRLTAGDRDMLYESRINPIASFPNSGFVIFGQKTLQFAKSSLDRVNVRRMLLEVRRLVENVALQLVFEQNNQSTRNRFISQVNPLLASIQSQQGIDSFRVIMDSSNNTPQDSEQNRLNGRIVLVPTRAVEFVAVDFIITNSGVSFE